MEIEDNRPLIRTAHKRRPHHGYWDKWGVALSVLCIIHCMAVPLLVIILPTFGLIFVPDEDLTHVILMGFVTGAAGLAFISGYRVHGQKTPVIWMAFGVGIIFVATFWAHQNWGHQWEMLLAFIGSLALIRAHLLNRKHCRVCEGQSHE